MGDYDHLLDKGRQTLRDIGWPEDGHVPDHEFLKEIQDLTVGHLWGDVWSRPHLSLRDRELVTLGTFLALARPAGMPNHFRGAKNLGLSREQIVEVMIQVAHYAGWPTLAHGLGIYLKVLEEDGDLE